MFPVFIPRLKNFRGKAGIYLCKGAAFLFGYSDEEMRWGRVGGDFRLAAL